MNKWLRIFLLKSNLLFTSNLEKPSEKYTECVAYQAKWAAVCGLRLLTGNVIWSLVIFALLLCTIFLSSFVFILLTDQKFLYYLRCTIIFSLGVQVYYKSISMCLTKSLTRDLIRVNIEFYKNNGDHPVKRKQLNEILDILGVFFKVFNYSYFLCFLGFIMQPVVVKYIFNKPLEPILPITLPFIDIHTLFGYSINAVFHFLCALFTAFATFAFDTMFCLFAMQYYAMHCNIIINLKDIEEQLENGTLKSEDAERSFMRKIYQEYFEMRV